MVRQNSADGGTPSSTITSAYLSMPVFGTSTLRIARIGAVTTTYYTNQENRSLALLSNSTKLLTSPIKIKLQIGSWYGTNISATMRLNYFRITSGTIRWDKENNTSWKKPFCIKRRWKNYNQKYKVETIQVLQDYLFCAS